MASKGKSQGLTGILLLLSGVILGSFVSELTKGVKGLSWLSYGSSFGIGSPTPFTVDLAVVKLTFGLSFHLSIAIILSLALSFYAWRKWF